MENVDGKFKIENCRMRMWIENLRLIWGSNIIKFANPYCGKNYSSEPITFKLISFLINRRLGYQAAKSPMMVTEANT